jgi:hypothetical protein
MYRWTASSGVAPIPGDLGLTSSHIWLLPQACSKTAPAGLGACECAASAGSRGWVARSQAASGTAR